MWETLENLTNVKKVNVNRDERFISVLAGTLFLVYALVRIPFMAIVSLAAAGYLFFRGVRGFCYIYDRLGQNTAVQLPQTEPFSNGESPVVPTALTPESR